MKNSKKNYSNTENQNQVIHSCRQPTNTFFMTSNNPSPNNDYLRKGEPNIISEPWEYSFVDHSTIPPTARHKMLSFNGAIKYKNENTQQNTTDFYNAIPQITLNTVYEFDSSASKVDAIFEIQHSECDPTTGKSFTLSKHGDLHLRDIHVRDTFASRNINAKTIIADSIIAYDISSSTTLPPSTITDEHITTLIHDILNNNTTTATLQHLQADKIHATNIIVETLTTTSDATVKENIQTIEKSNLETLRPVTYNYKKNINNNKKKKRYGLIAQEVEHVFPELVETDANTGQKSVNYTDIIALLIKDNQELREKIKNIERKLNI